MIILCHGDSKEQTETLVKLLIYTTEKCLRKKKQVWVYCILCVCVCVYCRQLVIQGLMRMSLSQTT